MFQDCNCCAFRDQPCQAVTRHANGNMSRCSQAALDVAAVGLFTGLLIQEQRDTGQMLVKARSDNPYTTYPTPKPWITYHT